MITTTDIANILYAYCKAVFPTISVVPMGIMLTGELREERICIHIKKQTAGTYWDKCFASIGIYVPDIRINMANTRRIAEIERVAKLAFSSVVGDFEGTSYEFGLDLGSNGRGSIGMEKDEALRSHFLHISLLFNVLNTN